MKVLAGVPSPAFYLTISWQRTVSHAEEKRGSGIYASAS